MRGNGGALYSLALVLDAGNICTSNPNPSGARAKKGGQEALRRGLKASSQSSGGPPGPAAVTVKVKPSAGGHSRAPTTTRARSSRLISPLLPPPPLLPAGEPAEKLSWQSPPGRSTTAAARTMVCGMPAAAAAASRDASRSAESDPKNPKPPPCPPAREGSSTCSTPTAFAVASKWGPTLPATTTTLAPSSARLTSGIELTSPETGVTKARIPLRQLACSLPAPSPSACQVLAAVRWPVRWETLRPLPALSPAARRRAQAQAQAVSPALEHPRRLSGAPPGHTISAVWAHLQ
eukprot:CAMPEP_0206137488 /NCGR_PEP_ID=MMETSP1473-20131121/2610_1 /ASSEMBLY_ACC=CAM_ASM_001109 /TAXON_ID=1461547 /ORGANISM="Stichococcus sp, Strain RCC1054" /LENGTH=291 /DNA_ID=CAMNT_0053530607 /DNA_START=410 /DNA_END=1287 /DNA_ORIENTATION=-